MSQPTLTVWCADEGCARYLEQETVPAYIEHDLSPVCRFEIDETCPECDSDREMMR